MGLFPDIVNATLRHLNFRRSYSRPEKKLQHKRIVRILLPRILDAQLVAINLRYDFIKHSFEAKELLLKGIRSEPNEVTWCLSVRSMSAFARRRLTTLERVDMSGYCTDELVTELSTYCPHLRHLSANNSKALSDVALSALTGMLRRGERDLFVRGCKQLKRSRKGCQF